MRKEKYSIHILREVFCRGFSVKHKFPTRNKNADKRTNSMLIYEAEHTSYPISFVAVSSFRNV